MDIFGSLESVITKKIIFARQKYWKKVTKEELFWTAKEKLTIFVLNIQASQNVDPRASDFLEQDKTKNINFSWVQQEQQ